MLSPSHVLQFDFRLITLFTRLCHWYQCWATLIQSTLSCFITFLFNIMTPSYLGLQSGFFPSGFPTKLVWIFILSEPRLSHRLMNAMVAQLKNCPFVVNTIIELKHLTTASVNTGALVSWKISGETPLLSGAVVLFLSSTVSLTWNGQFLYCANIEFSERHYPRLDGLNNGIFDRVRSWTSSWSKSWRKMISACFGGRRDGTWESDCLISSVSTCVRREREWIASVLSAVVCVRSVNMSASVKYIYIFASSLRS